MNRKFVVRLVAVLVVGSLSPLFVIAAMLMLPDGWGGACVVAMGLSSLVAGVALGSVSNRLNRYVYLDAVLFGEAKAGLMDAKVAIYAHVVFFASFFGFLHFKPYVEPV